MKHLLTKAESAEIDHYMQSNCLKDRDLADIVGVAHTTVLKWRSAHKTGMRVAVQHKNWNTVCNLLYGNGLQEKTDVKLMEISSLYNSMSIEQAAHWMRIGRSIVEGRQCGCEGDVPGEARRGIAPLPSSV